MSDDNGVVKFKQPLFRFRVGKVVNLDTKFLDEENKETTEVEQVLVITRITRKNFAGTKYSYEVVGNNNEVFEVDEKEPYLEEV